MRILIIADIHANITALKAVLVDAEGHGKVDEMWCLGDTVGYGPDPCECTRFVREACRFCVAGNHDLAAAGKTNVSAFNPWAADAIRWTQRHLSPEDINYLGNLPLVIREHEFTLVHGSPRDPVWEYLSSLNVAAENLPAFDGSYCLVGHTHRPLAFTFSGISERRVTELRHQSVIALGEDRLILNPGAVGQPRDGDPRASYGIIDDDSRTFSLSRVPYDIKSVQERMRSCELPLTLINRLQTGT